MADDEPTHIIPVDDAEAAFAARLAARLAPGAPPPTLAGEGFSNWVWRIEAAERPLAVKVGKPHRVGLTDDELRKELWCANAAADAGVPTPRALAAGRFEDRAYLVQAFAPGRQAQPDVAARVWQAMGRWARIIHAIPVAGWGNRLAADGVFDGGWDAHLAYNIVELHDRDPLIELGVLDAAGSRDLRRRFERLAATPFRIGLCHGDLAMFNVLVDEAEGGALSLIDWGCAFAGPVPHFEINEIGRDGRATPDELDLFRRACGLDDDAWAQVRADLPDLLALREVDTLRWGIERRPGEVEALAARARRALASLP